MAPTGHGHNMFWPCPVGASPHERWLGAETIPKRENNISTICLECNIPDIWTNKGYVLAFGVDFHTTAGLNKLKADILVKILKTDTAVCGRNITDPLTGNILKRPGN